MPFFDVCPLLRGLILRYVVDGDRFSIYLESILDVENPGLAWGRLGLAIRVATLIKFSSNDDLITYPP